MTALNENSGISCEAGIKGWKTDLVSAIKAPGVWWFDSFQNATRGINGTL
jgi:hypothetical protein